MKTKKYLKTTGNLKLFMILPVIAIALIAFNSCGKNKNTAASSLELAPPPPPPPVPDSVYVDVDAMAVFKDGDTGIINYLRDNTRYPEDAKSKGIQGKVVVRFVVEKDCSISQVVVVQSVSPSLDAEAVRVVSSLPKFEKPAFKTGEPVRVHYMVPILFNMK